MTSVALGKNLKILHLRKKCYWERPWLVGIGERHEIQHGQVWSAAAGLEQSQRQTQTEWWDWEQLGRAWGSEKQMITTTLTCSSSVRLLFRKPGISWVMLRLAGQGGDCLFLLCPCEVPPVVLCWALGSQHKKDAKLLYQVQKRPQRYSESSTSLLWRKIVGTGLVQPKEKTLLWLFTT